MRIEGGERGMKIDRGEWMIRKKSWENNIIKME